MSENHVTATHTATMSLSSVQAFFQSLQLDIPILETEANTATVSLAAAAHGVEPGRIAKTLAFRLSDGCLATKSKSLLSANGVQSLVHF